MGRQLVHPVGDPPSWCWELASDEGALAGGQDPTPWAPLPSSEDSPCNLCTLPHPLLISLLLHLLSSYSFMCYADF